MLLSCLKEEVVYKKIGRSIYLTPDQIENLSQAINLRTDVPVPLPYYKIQVQLFKRIRKLCVATRLGSAVVHLSIYSRKRSVTLELTSPIRVFLFPKYSDESLE